MIDFSKYSHIIWDWNGTLLNDAWLCVDVMNGMLQERNLRLLTLDDYRSVFDFPVKDYYVKIGFDFNKEAFEKVGMEFMIRYNLRQKESSLHPEVVDVLKAFKDKGYRQFILSAREQNELIREIHELGVFHYFDHICGLDDHYAHGKTDVGLEMVRKLNLPTDQLIFIGDTLHDAEVAAEIAIECALIPNGHNSRERLEASNLPIISSLKDLTGLI